MGEVEILGKPESHYHDDSHLPLDKRECFLENKDFWFPITLPEGIQGKLWTTRCPRVVEKGTLFTTNAMQNGLDKVLCLIENWEDGKYAGVNLDEWYKSIKIEMTRFPIKDFSTPQSQECYAGVCERLVSDLKAGKNCLIHCAGGSGRTGLILLGVYRLLGIKNPLEKLRAIKSVYVETLPQEQFGMALRV